MKNKPEETVMLKVTKRRAAQLVVFEQKTNMQMDSILESITDAVSNTFQSLINLHPEGALSVIEQLNNQVSEIKEKIQIENRAKENLVSKISSMIELAV